jgi:hypothetical protein
MSITIASSVYTNGVEAYCAVQFGSTVRRKWNSKKKVGGGEGELI